LWAQAATVEGVRLWRAPDHTRLVFDLSGPVNHKLFSLKQPSRIVIDVDKSKFSADIRALDFSNTPISNMRYGKRKANDLRIVLDVDDSASPRSFVLKKHAGKPDRLVIDLYDGAKKTVKTVEAVKRTEQAKQDIVIVIDAGHGGEDPGSVGPGRLYEKNVVLKVSKHLATLVEREPGYKAHLIRSGDYYVENTRRRERAREQRANLFVSIHAGAREVHQYLLCRGVARLAKWRES